MLPADSQILIKLTQFLSVLVELCQQQRIHLVMPLERSNHHSLLPKINKMAALKDSKSLWKAADQLVFIMSYYTVVAVALGMACAVAYTIYTSFSTAPARQQRPHTNRSRNEQRIERPPERYCELCNKLVHKDLGLSCGHQFHKSCLLRRCSSSQSHFEECVICQRYLSSRERSSLIEIENSVICTICQDGLDDAAIVLTCGHEFHHQCVIDMLNHESRNCPNCRTALVSADLRRIVSGIRS